MGGNPLFEGGKSYNKGLSNLCGVSMRILTLSTECPRWLASGVEAFRFGHVVAGLSDCLGTFRTLLQYQERGGIHGKIGEGEGTGRC